jgi:solute carrier family 25 aspartate/glutamate transporter 12/13
MSEKDYNQTTLKILANAVDLDKNGYILFDEFKRFEEILRSPDVLFKCAFQLFDNDGTGFISYDNFKFIIEKTTLHEMIPFDFNCEFIQNQFGKDKKRLFSYEEFTQIIHVS